MDTKIKWFILTAITLDIIAGIIIGQFVPVPEASATLVLLIILVTGAISYITVEIASYFAFKEWQDVYEVPPLIVISWGIMMLVASFF